MSFPRYPKYKPSGVEWLGEVPVGWEVKPLRNVFKFSKGLTITKEDLRDEGVCCVNYGEIHSKYGFRLNPRIHPLRCVAPEYLSSNPEALIRDGDFGFADKSEDLEGSGNFTHLRSDDPIFAGYHTIIARPRKGTCSLPLAYQIHSSVFRSQIQSQVKGVKVFSISQGILKGAKCRLPPLPEQTAIAEFLDRETGKIDGLVAEQRRLMELLKEKRQAVISHAVTKGLNPHAPMKPSGIEWLGDVPAHWEVGPLKRYWSVTDCKHVTAEFVEDGIPLASIREVQSRWVALENAKCTTEYFYDLLIEGGRCPSPGDLIFSRNATVGEVAQVPAVHPRFAMGQDVVLLRKLSPEYSSDYLQHVIRSPIIIQQLANMMIGSTFKRINVEEIRSFVVPSPPLAEQAEIAAFLEIETAKFDTLTAEAHRAIDLLQERRTALISAAVTGQIDVRPLLEKKAA